MAFKGRIQKLEASLEAKQKFYLWLEHAKAAGEFMSYWENYLKGPMAPFEWTADSEASFLGQLVIDLNCLVLQNASVNRDLRCFAHVALDGLLRQIARPPIHEVAEHLGKYMYARFKGLLEEALSLAAAIDAISETYLDGQDILFADARAELEAETNDLRKTASVSGSLAE